MFTLRRSPKFKRKLRKHLKGNAQLGKRILSVLQQLERDPFYPSLKSHKVRDRQGYEAFSSYVTGDLRIIWDYAEDKVDILDLLDIGGHEGSGKVYR